MNYLSEAFQKLSILDEDVFDLDKDGLEDLKDFQDEEEEEVIDIIDPEAETEEDLQDSYVGKVILTCTVCNQEIYKDKEDVIIDEETQLANVGEECPYCFSVTDGYKVQGQVEPFVETTFETEDDVDVEVDGEEVEDEEDEVEKNESFKRHKKIVESISRRNRKSLTEAPVYGLEPRYDSRKSFYGKAQVDTGDKGDKNKLYSYGTLVAEIKDGKPVVYGTYSATTLRHIKDWLKQNGFRAETSRQILSDYGVKDESCNGRKSIKESSGEVFHNDNGLDYTVVERSKSGKNALLNRGQKWIIAWNCPQDNNGSWGQGHYFFDEGEAREWWNKKYIKESKTPVKISRKSLKEGWRGTPVEMVSHGSWGDPDLVWDNGEHKYTFNYWDIEDAMWNMFLEETGHKDSESNDPEVEEEFNEYVRDNYEGYLEDVIWGGYFDDGSYSWHDRYKRESCNRKPRKAKKMKESIEDITIDTGDQEISVSAKDKEEVKSDDEMIAPLPDEVKDEIEMNSEEEAEEENGDEVDVDVDEFSEEEFDGLGESYLKKVYDNVDSYKTTSVSENGNKLKVEGLIKFNSGKQKKTTFVFESKTIDKSGRAKFIGENLQISRGHKSFKLAGTVSNKKFISESLNYNYKAKDGSGKSVRVYGTVKNNKK